MHSLNTKLLSSSRDNAGFNCEAYFSKLMQVKQNLDFPELKMNRTSKTTCSSATCPKRVQRNASGPVNQRRSESLQRKPSATRKPQEVIVEKRKSVTRNRSASPGKESWDKLLTHGMPMQQGSHSSRKPKTIGSFSTFDPLRTLHFLGSELKNKLKQKLPNDEYVQQMVTSMQQALIRIPRDIEKLEEILAKNQQPNRSELKTMEKSETGSQTPMELIPDVDSLKRQLEQSTEKLEHSCKQMEELSGQLSSEKDELSMLLQAEKETNRSLRKRIEELEFEKTEQMDKVSSLYKKQLEDVQNKVKEMKTQNDNSTADLVKSIESLKDVLQETRKEKDKIQTGLDYMVHNYEQMRLERDKFRAILGVRERQINEIHTEMSMLQNVVSHELLDMKSPEFVFPLIEQRSGLDDGELKELKIRLSKSFLSSIDSAQDAMENLCLSSDNTSVRKNHRQQQQQQNEEDLDADADDDNSEKELEFLDKEEMERLRNFNPDSCFEKSDGQIAEFAKQLAALEKEMNKSLEEIYAEAGDAPI